MARLLTDKKETKLKEYVRESGITFAEISRGSDFGKDTVSRALKRPARTSLKTYLTIAKMVKMPIDEAEAEWKESRKQHVLEKEGLL